MAMDDDDVYGSGYVDFMVDYLAAHPKRQLVNLDGYISMSVDEDGVFPATSLSVVLQSCTRLTIGCTLVRWFFLIAQKKL